MNGTRVRGVQLPGPGYNEIKMEYECIKLRAKTFYDVLFRLVWRLCCVFVFFLSVLKVCRMVLMYLLR